MTISADVVTIIGALVSVCTLIAFLLGWRRSFREAVARDEGVQFRLGNIEKLLTNGLTAGVKHLDNRTTQIEGKIEAIHAMCSLRHHKDVL